MAIPSLDLLKFDTIELAKKKPRPQFTIIYSTGGCGKTTAACYSPEPVLVPMGRETGHEIHANWGIPCLENNGDINPVIFPFAAIARLLKTEHTRKTVIFDNFGTFRECVDEDVEADNKGADLKAYGRGMALAYPYYTRLLAGFDMLMKKKEMHVILLAHSINYNINKEDGSYYSKTGINAPSGENTNVRGLLEARAHNIFHMVDETPTRIVAGPMGGKRTIATAGDIKRIIYTKPQGTAFAKSRVNLEPFYEIAPSETEEELFKNKSNPDLIKFWSDVYK